LSFCKTSASNVLSDVCTMLSLTGYFLQMKVLMLVWFGSSGGCPANEHCKNG